MALPPRTFRTEAQRANIRELVSADVDSESNGPFRRLYGIDPTVRDAVVEDISTHVAGKIDAQRRTNRRLMFNFAFLVLMLLICTSSIVALTVVYGVYAGGLGTIVAGSILIYTVWDNPPRRLASRTSNRGPAKRSVHSA